MTAPAAAAMTLRGVRKRYGRTNALDGLELEVPRGSVCGLIGPNGAGKTTTFGIAGGFLSADEGTVDLLGEGPFDPQKHVGRITLLPQDCELNPHVPVRDLLAHFARLQGLSAADAARDAARVLAMVELADRGGSKIRTLSHGMRRRVAIAQAFLGEPELVLLDEPTNGLDPELVVKMRELFRAQRGKRTLVVSSHNLAELEAACDHVIFLEAGRCVKAGSLQEVTRVGAVVRIALAARVPLDAITSALPGARIDWEAPATLVIAAEGHDVGSLNALALPALLGAGARVLEVRSGRSLEEAYLQARAAAAAQAAK